MEKSIVLKQIEKGTRKQLNASKRRLLHRLQDQTYRNLSFNISLLSDMYDELIYDLNIWYVIENHPTSNTDRKALLMQLFKQNIALVDEFTGRAVEAKIIEQTDTYTDYVYNERTSFKFEQVYNIIMSARKSATEAVKTGVTYRRFKNVIIVSESVEPVAPVAPVEPVAPETAPAPAGKKKRERKPKNQAA